MGVREPRRICGADRGPGKAPRLDATPGRAALLAGIADSCAMPARALPPFRGSPMLFRGHALRGRTGAGELANARSPNALSLELPIVLELAHCDSDGTTWPSFVRRRNDEHSQSPTRRRA